MRISKTSFCKLKPSKGSRALGPSLHRPHDFSARRRSSPACMFIASAAPNDDHDGNAASRSCLEVVSVDIFLFCFEIFPNKKKKKKNDQTMMRLQLCHGSVPLSQYSDHIQRQEEDSFSMFRIFTFPAPDFVSICLFFPREPGPTRGPSTDKS